jgi:hypothetical protein
MLQVISDSKRTIIPNLTDPDIVLSFFIAGKKA